MRAVSMPQDFNAYSTLLKLVEGGRYEEASLESRRLRDQFSAFSANDEAALRNLISARIALKNRGGERAVTLDPLSAEDPFLRAELYFVRGLTAFHEAHFEAGAEDFSRAAEEFNKLGLVERALLSRFNRIIGLSSTVGLVSSQATLDSLRQIEAEAERTGSFRIMGLVARQKSYVYQSDFNRRRAALEEALTAARWLELHGPKSDHDLARIQAADCLIDLERFEEARTQLEYVLGPGDERILFPVAYVQARLGGAQPDPAAFRVTTSVWLKKFNGLFLKSTGATAARPRVRWDKLSGELHAAKGPITLKVNSLEGRLLQILSAGVHSKSLLCEKLWPGQCDLEHLDNRLHSLISRCNRKTGSMIAYDGAYYSLTADIESA